MEEKHYKYYVVFKSHSMDGAIFLTLSDKINTEEIMVEVTNHVSKNCCNGEPVVVTNVILLDGEELRGDVKCEQ